MARSEAAVGDLRLIWHNWGRTHEVTPARWAAPQDVDEVVSVVREAVRDGLRVKAVGSGHSFSDAAVARDLLVDLHRMDRVRSVDAASGIVTVEAGLTLHRLSRWLWGAGLALANLGDIDKQTVAGAISTGTHGTGLRFGSLSSQVKALELVLADGSVVECSETERPDLFQAARVGIGAFGVITAVTLQCVPAFPLLAHEGPEDLPPLLEGIEAFAEENDHSEFFWFPYTTKVYVKRNQRLAPGSPLDPLPRWRTVLEDEVLANAALDVFCRLGAAGPNRIPTLNRTAMRLLGHREYADRSYRVFASPRRTIFRESEYGIPRELVRDVLKEIDAWLARPGHQIGFPMEVRFGAAEDSWLSMAYGRETAWIAAQTHRTQDHEPFFAAVRDIMREAGGRPHWGKIHAHDAGQLRELYPRFGDVLAVRDAVDPGRVFANSFTERVFGP